SRRRDCTSRDRRRLRDHIEKGAIDLSAVRAVVLDEADEMLDLGFREDLEFILGSCPEGRQTLLFSATVPASIARLAQSYQRDALRVVVKSETKQHADIEYKVMTVAPRDGDAAIINALRYFEAPNAIVFCNTRAMVSRLTTRLSNRGFSVVALSGELTQNERTNALQAMRDGRARVCVATDVAARGIDLPNLDLVVHAELPSNHETLLHRSGRTGRAGRKGVSALVVEPRSKSKADRILKGAKLDADWGPAPSADAVKGRDRDRMLADPEWQADIAESEADTVATLMTTFSPEQLAAAYLRLYNTRHSAPEELADFQDRGPKPKRDKAAFGPSVWFSVSGGRLIDAEPRRLLPMVCKAGDLGKDDIGAIRVAETESFVELRADAVDGFKKSIGADMVIEGSKVTELANPPAIANAPRPGFKDRGPRKGPNAGYSKGPGKPKRDGDWDKPKPDSKPTYAKKPKHDLTRDGAVKPLSGARAPSAKSDRPRFDAAKSDAPRGKPAGPKSKLSGSKPKPAGPKGKKQKTGGKSFKPDGTPVGKANSKKNKARRAAAAGGDAMPKRRG
ncbi:MAG: helicase-related protein, partial [Pseudomonadota bacterium]